MGRFLSSLAFVVFVIGIICIPFYQLFVIITAHPWITAMIVLAIATVIHAVRAYFHEEGWEAATRATNRYHRRYLKDIYAESRRFHANHGGLKQSAPVNRRNVPFGDRSCFEDPFAVNNKKKH